jgi:hypothetical protein
MVITVPIIGVLIIGLILGIMIHKYITHREGFQMETNCDACGQSSPCRCPNPRPRPIRPADPECRQPDMNKYVLKTTIPPCPALPDMSNYILKSECPPVPDLSNYVLKSSIPKQSPVILDCSKCQKPSGECPPCPRARCPEVKCPPPTKCPACAPCARQSCPPATISCKANNEVESSVRPYLAPLSFSGFGMA